MDGALGGFAAERCGDMLFLGASIHYPHGKAGE
jgi:hypothetical protein